MADVRIATAGWSIASDYLTELPPGGTHLERYGRRLNAVEINSSFHRPHRRATYERWAAATPAGFRFAVKLPKTISHERALVDCSGALGDFLAAASGLEEKLAVLLIQLPPKLAYDAAVFGRFTDDLRQQSDAAVALEPRHASWFTDEVNAVLEDRRIARVAADPPRAPGGDAPGGCTRLVYYRWHGAPRVYYSSYSNAQLAGLADQLKATAAEQAWVVFDNTAFSAALGNALALASLTAGAQHD